MRWSSVSPARRFSNGCALGSLSENYSLWFSVSPLCLCGESFFKEFHHRDTEHHRVCTERCSFRQTPEAGCEREGTTVLSDITYNFLNHWISFSSLSRETNSPRENRLAHVIGMGEIEHRITD